MIPELIIPSNKVTSWTNFTTTNNIKIVQRAIAKKLNPVINSKHNNISSVRISKLT